jgi:hypothetical protein
VDAVLSKVTLVEVQFVTSLAGDKSAADLDFDAFSAKKVSCLGL